MSETENETKKRGNRLREMEAKAAVRRRFAVGALILLACGFGGALFGWSLLQPRASHHRAIKVQVPAGSAGDALEHAGIIRSGLAFDLYARWHGENGRLRPGRYTLSPTMTPAQIIRQLLLGPGHSPDDIISVVVPPGFTVRLIAERLEKLGVTDGTAFLQSALNPQELKWNADFPKPKGSLEGYLYPDTYEFLPDTPAEKVLDAMVLNFSRRFFRPYRQQIAARGKSLHEIVTIASLIEREAAKQEDRPHIAGVLENRLNKGMKLQIDATVIYALGRRSKQRVYNKDLQVASPYNTYRHFGLPPGPIASPGLRSLEAALLPEKNDFLYYVARPNRYHYFTRTRQEHEAAVKQSRLEFAEAAKRAHSARAVSDPAEGPGGKTP